MIKKRPPFLLFLIVVFTVGLFGCAGKIKETKMIPESDDDFESSSTPPVRDISSLWQDTGVFSRLYVDHKAKYVGDIITISVVESSSASKKATTQTKRQSSIKAAIDKFFKLEEDFPGTHRFFNPFSGVEGGIENDFNGSGATTRSGTLSTTIAAKVTEVLPGGNLVIEGKRETVLNNEEQIIILRGIIRPEDVSINNVVLSTHIADARIVYRGKGVINDKQRPGWLTKVFDQVWPF